MDRSLSRRALLFLLSALLCACGAKGDEKLIGHWVYFSAETGGKVVYTSGDLKLAADGTFDDARRIGGIGGYRKGTYSAKGDQLTLSYEGTSQSFSYHLGKAQGSAGVPFDTLMLRGNDLTYMLSRKKE